MGKSNSFDMSMSKTATVSETVTLNLMEFFLTS